MGLRETKNRRTRDALHDAALTLTEQHGYDAVTIEQISERAQVAVSTIYRYYPNKDAILLEPFTRNVGTLAAAVRDRPADEPLDQALGHALQEFVDAFLSDPAATNRLRAQLDIAPGPRARLWDVLAQERGLLEVAIAERAGLDAGELRVVVAAHTTVTIANLVLDRQRDSVEQVDPAVLLDEVLRAFAGGRADMPMRAPQR
jgi:AcrR family transcriptional regulator